VVSVTASIPARPAVEHITVSLQVYNQIGSVEIYTYNDLE
jgi:hypothetical protein